MTGDAGAVEGQGARPTVTDLIRAERDRRLSAAAVDDWSIEELNGFLEEASLAVTEAEMGESFKAEADAARGPPRSPGASSTPRQRVGMLT